MLNEVYKDIVGFEGIYQVSNFGNVKNQHGKILKTYKINSGYLCLKLHDATGKRSSHLVHRLVATAFLDNPKTEVNHIDGNKHNNTLTNLEWCTSSENKRHALYTGLMVYNKPTLGKKLTRNGKPSASEYFGVTYDNTRRKWIGTVVHNKVKLLHKRYSTELEAARARDAIVLTHNLNLPLNF